jgi:hypothetical protein
MPEISLNACLTLIDPPSLFAPTPVWRRYLADLRKMPRCASVRSESARARQELARRRQIEIAKRAELASRQLDLFPETAPKISLPPLRPWSSPHAQLLWGQALIFSGKKHRDPTLIRKGWINVRQAREQIHEQ